MTAYLMRRTRPLNGTWFYEVAHCDCGCVIITSGRQHLQRGEELFCETHDRIVKAVRVEADTLAQQDALCSVNEQISESSANAIANEPTMLANG